MLDFVRECEVCGETEIASCFWHFDEEIEKSVKGEEFDCDE